MLAKAQPTDRDVTGHAEAFLKEKGIPASQIIKVNVDSILYVNVIGNAWTCWLDYDEITNKLEYTLEQGFPSERS